MVSKPDAVNTNVNTNLKISNNFVNLNFQSPKTISDSIFSSQKFSLDPIIANINILQDVAKNERPDKKTLELVNKINKLPDTKSRILEYNKQFNSTKDNYILIDKIKAKGTVCSYDGKIIRTFEVGTGSINGDAPNFADIDNEALNASGRTTPAGEYHVDYKWLNHDRKAYEKEYGGKLISFCDADENKTRISFHQIYLPKKNERLPLFYDGKPENNRMSYGCINSTPEDFDIVEKYLPAKNAKFYVLPEDKDNQLYLVLNKNGELVFKSNKYDKVQL